MVYRLKSSTHTVAFRAST